MLQRLRRSGWFLALLLAGVVLGLPVVSLAPTSVVSATSVTLVGAGDIATCANSNAAASAALLDTIAGTVFTLGDNAYDSGSAQQFATCYDPSWGRHKARTRPAVGNHEYYTAGASGYFGYFGAAAGDPSKGYYSYDLGAWHIVVLNSNCGKIGGCQAGSAQEKWLRADLAAHPSVCTLAYWHSPRFSSGASHGNDLAMQPIWQALYDADADVVLSGHDHDYERFAPQDPLGTADAPVGLRQFVVGTGGKGQEDGFGTTQPNSEVRNNGTVGVLKLTLADTSYSWQFVPVAGQTFTDAGQDTCHGSAGSPTATPTGTPTRTPTPTPTATPTVEFTAGNLLLNPSFELDADQDQRPDSWSTDNRFLRDAALPHSGSYAGRHQATDNSGYTIYQQVDGITPGKSYTMSGWVNIPATSDAFTFDVKVRWRDTVGNVISSTTLRSYTGATAGWDQASAVGIAPAGTTNARFVLLPASLNATIYVDDLVLRETATQPTNTPTATANATAARPRARWLTKRSARRVRPARAPALRAPAATRRSGNWWPCGALHSQDDDSTEPR